LKPPYIPYMGLISKDIATIEENNSDVIEHPSEEEEGKTYALTNFQKMR